MTKAMIGKRYHFSAGHFLPNVPEDHPCGRQHGHNYCLEVSVSGDVDPFLGWLIDFNALDAYIAPQIEVLDHQNLNDIEGLSNPTAENVSAWFIDCLKTTSLWEKGGVWKVRVWETPKCWAEITEIVSRDSRAQA